MGAAAELVGQVLESAVAAGVYSSVVVGAVVVAFASAPASG